MSTCVFGAALACWTSPFRNYTEPGFRSAKTFSTRLHCSTWRVCRSPQMSRRESLRLYCQRLEKPQACSANRLNHVKSQPSQEPACASQISCMDADPRVSAVPARFRPFSEGATRVAGLVRDRFDGTSLCKRGSYMFAQEQSGVEDWYPAAGALRQANPRSIGPCPETLCRTLNPKP